MQNNENAERPFPLENLFVGHFREVAGIAQTVDGPVELIFSGELLLSGVTNGEEFDLQALHRVFLVGSRADPIKPDPIGVLSLGGPLFNSELVFEEGSVQGIQFNLYYRRLSREDPIYPGREQIEGQLNWESITVIEEDVIQLNNLDISTLEMSDPEYVISISFTDSPSILLYRATTDSTRFSQPFFALPPPPLIADICPDPVDPCPSGSPTDIVRYIPVKFINLTGTDITSEVENQIRKICCVWHKKAGLDLRFHPNDAAGPSLGLDFQIAVPLGGPGGFEDFIDADSEDLDGIPEVFPGTYVHIVIVNSLNVMGGITNGITYRWGTVDAICIISKDALEEEPLICAHELSHVLNLDHFTDPWYGHLVPPPPVGEEGSIADVPFTNFNTEHNRQFFFSPLTYPDIPYLTTSLIDAYCPDPNVNDTQSPDVSFLNNVDDPLEHVFSVPSDSSGLNLNFRVLVTDNSDFDAESITFEVTWRRRNDPSIITVVFAFNGSTWLPSSTTPTAATISNPDDIFHCGKAVIFDGTIQVTGEFSQIEIEVNVTDLASNTTPAIDARHEIDIAIPTDIMLLLDHSGSMRQTNAAGQSKWASAVEAANLFNAIYSALNIPELNNQIGLVRFFADGLDGADLTDVPTPLAPPSTAAPLVSPSDPIPLASYWTPMGSAVVTGYNALVPSGTAANWRNRIMILLTDGRENRAPTLAAVRMAAAGTPNYVPNKTEDPQRGCQIFPCAFGQTGQIDTGPIQSVAIGDDGFKSYDGVLHSTESTASPEEAFFLKEQFLSLIVDTISAELIGPFDSSFVVEEGVSELICIVTDNVSFTISAPSAHTATISPVDASQPGFAWVRISNPAPGNWSLGGFSPSPSVQGFAVVDLTLKTDFGAGRADIGIGRPISLSAEIQENGIGVSGATVTVRVEGPGESVGQMLTNYTQHQSFNLTQWQKQLRHVSKTEPVSLQSRLLKAAFEQRGFGLRRIENQVTLTEKAPGRYEGVWSDTLEEGTYTFHFQATGQTDGNYRFQRNYSLSRHLAPVPDPEQTTVTWSSQPIADKKFVLWQATIMPRTASGRPLGPGLADKLGFQLASNGRPKKGNEILPVNDNLDGSYAVELTLPPGKLPPILTLRFGNHREPLPPPRLRPPAGCV